MCRRRHRHFKVALPCFLKPLNDGLFVSCDNIRYVGQRVLHASHAALETRRERSGIGCSLPIRLHPALPVRIHRGNRLCRATDHIRSTHQLIDVVRVFRVATSLESRGEAQSIATRVRRTLIPALNQAREVVAEFIWGLVRTVLVTAAGHVVSRRDTTTGEVFDVAVVVRAGDDTLSPARLKAPLAQEDGRIYAKSLSNTFSQRPSLSNEL